jgi:eukaryotic-like serine/threonine-protein kinase
MRAIGEDGSSFGDLLRRARREAGLTQEELAEKAGLSVRGISDLERGARRAPRPDTLDLLAQALQLGDDEIRDWRRARRQSGRSPAPPIVAMLQPTTLVGRDREFGLLRDAVERAISGKGQVILLGGEPGVGKTRLAEGLSGYSRERDAWTLWGRCYEGEGAPAYWPWVQIIRACSDSLAADVLRRDLGRGASAIAQLVGDIRDKLPGLPPAQSLSPEQARFELFDSVTRFLRSVSLRMPLVLVLDDLHWADQSSLDLLSFASREIESSRIAVIGTYRDTELDLVPRLARTIADLSRSLACEHLILSGLAKADVSHLVERVLNEIPPDEIVAEIYERTEGNPFFVTEVARILSADGSSRGREGVGSVLTTIPPGVKSALEQRFRKLSDECHIALSMASVVGREFSLGELGVMSEKSRQQLVAALDEATRSRLIERMAGSVGRYRFSHALVRETLYDALPSAERAQLHRRVGEFLERAHETEPGPHLTILAHHFFEALPASDAVRAIDYSMRAGDRAISQFAYAEAVDQYRRALGALELDLALDSELRCDVLLKLGDAHSQAGQYQAAQDAFGRAASISREMGLSERLARAAVGAAGLGVIEHGERDHRQLLEYAVAALPKETSLLRSQVLARLSIVLQGPDVIERRRAYAEEAESIARELDEAPALLYALLARHRSLWTPGLRAERLHVARQLPELMDHVDGSTAVPAIPYRMYDALEAGDMSAADRLLDMFTTRVRELRQPQRLWIDTQFRAMRAMMDGRFDQAEELIVQARTMGATAAPTLAVADHFMFAALLGRERGRFGEMAHTAQQIDSWYPRDLFWQSLLTAMESETHGAVQPVRQLDDLIDNVEDESPFDGSAIVAAVLLASTPGVDRNPERAARLYRILLPYVALNAVMPNSRHFYCFGSVAHTLGVLARCTGRFDDASRHFDSALTMHRLMGAAPYLARTCFEFARTLTERGEPTDLARARELAGAAHRSAKGLGMTSLMRQSAILLNELSAI